jgi:hypothetical protein
MPVIPEWLRSALITFATTLALTITATDFEFTQAAALAAVVASLRTTVSAFLPGGSFGRDPYQP